MARITTVSESVVIAADAVTLYNTVSDPRNMARWSPENTGASLRAGDDGAAYLGMDFWGHNKRGIMSWATQCIVTAADSGQKFAFQVKGQRMGGREKARLAFDIARWEYTFEAADGGTKVTETWIDTRSSSLFGRSSRMGDRLFIAGSTFPDHHRRNMRITLDKLKAEAEAS